jgi:glutamate synthase (NADPH/NADH) small chain
LSAAYFLNRAGFGVTVYEGDRKVGGYLRYGIPDFKLDKNFIDRRIRIMESEGVVFKTNTRVGAGVYAFGTGSKDCAFVEPAELEANFDLVLLTIGARDARDITVPGRENGGIVQALDYLSLQNRNIGKEVNEGFEPITAYGKRVVVIGGGDTGSDCVGTANRQGARSVTQIEVMPKPPEHRPASSPWPLWPTVLKTSSSHAEGCERLWSVNTKSFTGKGGVVDSIQACGVDWASKDGRMSMTEVPGTGFEIGADLVLLAMGFTHVVQDGVVAGFGLELDQRGNVRTQGSFHTSNPKVWAAGDSRNGASLVVRAIADGRAAAEAIVKAL